MSCPICQKPTQRDFDPFCSMGCKNIDLLHWLKEDYKVPSEETVLDSEDLDEEEPQS